MMTIDRRHFIRAAAIALVAPKAMKAIGSSPTTAPVDHALRCERVVHRYFDNRCRVSYKVSKGPYEHAGFNFCHTDHPYPLSMIRDVRGLCATYEMAHVIATDIMYGLEGCLKLFDIDWDDAPLRNHLLQSLRRTEITPPEFRRLIAFISDLRGPHECLARHRPVRVSIPCLPGLWSTRRLRNTSEL